MTLTTPTTKATPVVKWAGGKRQLQERILDVIAQDFHQTDAKYFEPFFGGGAILFALMPKCAAVSDLNQGLINVYEQIKMNPAAMARALRSLEVEYNSLSAEQQANFYYDSRAKFNGVERTGLEFAAQFIFLNKAGFNGMYRENSKGDFNIPFGKRRSVTLFDQENLIGVSVALAGVDLHHQDYQETIAEAKAGDLVYFDPPYVPLTETAAFTSYNADGFGYESQRQLADVFKELTRRGVRVALSNSSSPIVQELYKGYTFRELTATRAISARAEGRARVLEYLVTNFE